MCETKTVLESLSKFLLVAASFCIYQTHTEKKVGHHSEINIEGRCENAYKEYCLNGSERYDLVDEGIVG